MLSVCPKCKRKRRVIQSLRKIDKKMYWVDKCIECATPMKLDGKEKGDK